MFAGKCISFFGLFTIGIATAAGASAGQVVGESARETPVVCQVDIVVVGGSTGAVAAAVAAAESGAKCFWRPGRPILVMI